MQTDGQISWDSPFWTNLKNNGGGTVAIVEDPLMGGSVFKYVVTEFRTEGDNFRVYTGKSVPRLEGGPFDWSYSQTVLFGPDCLPKVKGQAISIMSFFSEDKALGDGDYDVIAGVDIYEQRKVVLQVKTPRTGGVIWAKYRSRKELKPNVRYTFRLFTRDDLILVEVNGEIWASGKLHPGFIGIQPVMWHAGLYGVGIDPGPDAYLLNGESEFILFRRGTP